MCTKFDNLQAIIHDYKSKCNGFKFTAIGVSETYFNVDNENLFELNGYNVFTLSRKSTKGGGLAIYLDEDFTATEIIGLRSPSSHECFYQFMFF